jgi:peptidoglycan hydrolase-like protein with peptidoglycan-binding domain
MQRQHIQERLREMSLYTGPIDAIMGPLTREAIMGYQRSKGARVTGYLTPEQFDALLPEGK